MTFSDLLKKTLPIVLVFALILGISFYFSKDKTEVKTYPELSNPNGVFATINGVDITNNEMYAELVSNYGISQLDDDINFDLLSAYVTKAKNDSDFDIDAEYEKEIYGSSLKEAKKTMTSAEIEEKELEFKENLSFNNLTEDKYKEFIYLKKSLEIFTNEKLENDFKNDELYTLSDVISYYNDEFYDKAYAVQIELNSVEQALELYKKFGYEAIEDKGILKQYVVDGTIIEPGTTDYPVDTTDLEPSNEELLNLFVSIYNLVYSDRTPLVIENGEILDYTSNENLTFVYEDYSSTILRDFMFKELNTESNPYEKYPTPISINNDEDSEDTKVFLTLKFAGQNENSFVTDFLEDDDTNTDVEANANTFESADKQESFDEIIEAMISADSKNTSIQQDYINELRASQNLSIEDYRLNKSYKSSIDENLKDTTGSNEYVYKYGSKTVSADDFFDTLVERYGAFTYVNIANEKLLTSNTELVESAITDDVKQSILQTLESYKYGYQTDSYASYGFSVSNTTWNDFLSSILGADSEIDYYNQQVVKQLSAKFLNNELRIPNETEHYNNMISYYNDYYTLDTNNIKLYVDRDGDFIEDLTPSEEDQALMEELGKLIIEKFESIEDFEEDELKSFISEYNSASTDDTQYGKYVLQGIKVKSTEFLAVNPETDLDEELLNEIKSIYQKIEKDNLSSYLSTNLVSTKNGFYVIYADNLVEKEKVDKDSDVTFPTQEQINMYFDDQEELDEETIDFIAKYFVTPLNEYVSKRSSVLYSKERKSAGETISSITVKNTYDNIVAVYEARQNRELSN